MMGGWVRYVYVEFVWRLVKYVLHWWTGRCELLRITGGVHNPLQRTRRIETSLRLSRQRALQAVLSDDQTSVQSLVEQIVSVKGVKLDQHPEFPVHLQFSLEQIVGYRHLVNDVEALRRTTYSTENAEHEAKLLQLWGALQPDAPLRARVGEQWGEVGFQGDDPATDFRGMGLLGLENLLYLATKHGDITKQLLLHSVHPQFGYSFAIVGINLTSVACMLLREGHLKAHFYSCPPSPNPSGTPPSPASPQGAPTGFKASASDGAPTLDDFHYVYVYLFVEWDKFWFAARPADIMQFNVIKSRFSADVIQRLDSLQSLPLRLSAARDSS